LSIKERKNEKEREPPLSFGFGLFLSDECMNPVLFCYGMVWFLAQSVCVVMFLRYIFCCCDLDIWVILCVVHVTGNVCFVVHVLENFVIVGPPLFGCLRVIYRLGWRHNLSDRL